MSRDEDEGRGERDPSAVGAGSHAPVGARLVRMIGLPIQALRVSTALAILLSGLAMPGCAHQETAGATAPPAVRPAQQDSMDEGTSPGVDETVVAHEAEASDTDVTAFHEEARDPPAPQVPPRSGPRCRACAPPAAHNIQCVRSFPCATACDQPPFSVTCAPCVPPAVDLSECRSEEAERGRGASGGPVR